jgi:hypothetical protein
MLLLYGMVETGPTFTPPRTGVRGAVVLVSSGVPRCLYSTFEKFEHGDSEQLKSDALEFFSVTEAALKQTTIIPFRFPTLLEDEAALGSFLDEHGPNYAAELEQLRGMVQINVSLPAIKAEADRSSGTAYLESKRAGQRLTEEWTRKVQQAAPAKAWKQQTHSGNIDGEVVHALVEREAVTAFRNAIRAALPQARVSGPWAPTAFVNCYPDLH